MDVDYREGSSTRSQYSSRLTGTIARTRAHSPPTADEALALPAEKRYKRRTNEKTSVVSCSPAQTTNMASSSPTRPDDDKYQRALDFLSANEPEQCLRVQLAIDKYKELHHHAENLYGEKNAKVLTDIHTLTCPDTSTVIIHTAPSSLHGMISAHLQTAIYHAAAVELERHNKPELVRRLKAYGESSDRPSFGGYDSRVSKTPDGGLIYIFNNRDVLALVIETGLTEDYDKLQNDIRLWLQCMILLIISN
ncbi:hypothetical protein V1522DRAFT_438200 [Lipomyces starkeyi]